MISLFSCFILGITGILLFLAFQAPTKRSIGIPSVRKGIVKEEPIDVEELKAKIKSQLKERMKKSEEGK